MVADTDFEASRAPVNELNSTLGLESGHSLVNVVGNNITAVQQASSHVFAVSWVAFHHLVVGFKARHGDLLNRIGFMLCLGSGDNGSISNQREMNARIGDEVGLEFCKIDIERAVKSEGCSDRGNDYDQLARLGQMIWDRVTLSNKSVQVLVVRSFNSKIASADLVDCLVVDHETAIRVFQRRMSGENRVVGLDDCCSYLRSRIDAELKLALFAIINREAFHQQGTKARAGTTTKGVED